VNKISVDVHAVSIPLVLLFPGLERLPLILKMEYRSMFSPLSRPKLSLLENNGRAHGKPGIFTF
jgi:hypothetical protein